MEIYNESMNNLWQQWESRYSSVCKDGIIEPKLFEKSRYKILFVLKETNKYSGSLTEFLKNGPKYQMWNTVARWAAGFLNDFPEYQSINNKAERATALKHISVINLKKIKGESYSDMKIIRKYANDDKDLILNQIHLIAPNIIIACGTFNILIDLFKLPDNDNKPMKMKIKDDFDTLVIPSRHPCRADNKKTYEEFKKQFLEFKDKWPAPNTCLISGG